VHFRILPVGRLQAYYNAAGRRIKLGEKIDASAGEFSWQEKVQLREGARGRGPYPIPKISYIKSPRREIPDGGGDRGIK
jgi:hypothetical protein